MLEVPPTYLEVPQKAITEETNGPPLCSNQLLTGNPYMSCFKYIQMDVPKSQIHRYKECKYKITQIQDMASINCLQNIYNTMYEKNWHRFPNCWQVIASRNGQHFYKCLRSAWPHFFTPKKLYSVFMKMGIEVVSTKSLSLFSLCLLGINSIFTGFHFSDIYSNFQKLNWHYWCDHGMWWWSDKIMDGGSLVLRIKDSLD